MFLTALQELIGLTIPPGYEPLAFVIGSFASIWLMTEFLKLIRTVVVR